MTWIQNESFEFRSQPALSPLKVLLYVINADGTYIRRIYKKQRTLGFSDTGILKRSLGLASAERARPLIDF
jgi:hypothetical protein